MQRFELTEHIRLNQKVLFDGIEYIPQAYILRLVKDKWIHSAELKDLNVNCVVIADLGRVESIKVKG